ncbi:MAG: glucose-1-phosphate adenylyltransferase [Deltaproteobacteria bacterium]|nr:glucose-1-phosphate adenylyltransferase [Deltaproteobacteria bacterium]
MRKTTAIVFAGGRVKELSVLTFFRPKAAVVYGGGYRVIDFTLTNLASTPSIENVGILTKYRPSSLIDHVGIGLAWDFVGAKRGVRILAPYVGPDHEEWQHGTTDALYQNIDFLHMHRADDVLVVGADHAYFMDFEPMLRFHMERAADVTVAFTPVNENASRFGIAELNSQGRIVSYMEKPEHPRTNLASMTVYVFRSEALIEELTSLMERSAKPTSFQIYDDILPRMIERRAAYGWVHDGDWDYTRTLDAYYRVHQDMLGDSPRIDFSKRVVRTNPLGRRVAPPGPTRFGPHAEVIDSLICAGCRIDGRVERSVLSPNVEVGKGAVVKNSILWNDTVVEPGAKVDMVISDKRCVIGKEARVGIGDETLPNRELPTSLSCGATVLGMEVVVPNGARIGRNCIIYPRAGSDEIGRTITSGTTLRMP